MLRLLTLAALLLSSVPAHAVSLVGLWLTQDHDGVMRVSACNGGLCVEIAGVILDDPSDPTPVDYRGGSQCHLRLISDAKPIGPNLWKGHIQDPRNGSIYGVELRSDPHGNLALRGFLGIPLLGQTQIWTRFPNDVPDDCRMSAVTAEAKTRPPIPERPH
jgi:uncharacterized protein (DUF2147 family)